MKLTQKEQQARKKVCLPLDGIELMDDARKRVEELSPFVGLFKVGKESYTRFGPEIVEMIQSYGSNVFLDLKYHDIPNTVRGAAQAATELGVYMFNVHASGGSEMLRAAVQGAEQTSVKYNITKPKIIAVTVLTSIDQNTLNEELHISGSVEDHVLQLANQTHRAGLDGIVCSAADLYAITDHLPKDFMYVTPGIKGPNTPAGKDQKRVMTPGKAIQDGSSILVIGRAITAHNTAKQRQQAAYDVLKDMAQYL